MTTKILPDKGDGTTASSPLNFVLIITDGLNDIDDNYPSGVSCDPDGNRKCGSPLDPSLCTPLKQKATVGVIYTTYVPFIANSGDTAQYQYVAQPSLPQIWPNLQACATNTGLAYQATNGSDIIAAFQQLFVSTLIQARLQK